MLILLAIIAALLAQLARDRTLFLALLMFVPLAPLAASAIVWDVLSRGHALSPRWLLLGAGVVTLSVAVALSWTPARAPTGGTAQSTVTVAQWNTQWGGTESLSQIVDRLQRLQADIVCLSEAPVQELLQQAWNERRPGWSFATAQHAEGDPYWYRLTVMSRYPVALRRQWALSIGRAALFEVAHAARPLNILMVDLRSSPTLPRSASIREAARIVEKLSKTATPVALVLGDFNTPGRFIGFDALTAAGFARAALWSGQWRATWPSHLPLSPYDIDHVWVGPTLQVAEASIFSSPGSDHRGQVALLRL